MTVIAPEDRVVDNQRVAETAFARALGLAGIESVTEVTGGQWFLKFRVGRNAPIYGRALWETQKSLPQDNEFYGRLGLRVEAEKGFPTSLEAQVLKGILARSTRVISSHDRAAVDQYVPFQNHEEDLVIQAANHLILGRRGVGKSTLISKAQELLAGSGLLSVVLDMQSYSMTSEQELLDDVLDDLCRRLAELSATTIKPGSEEVAAQFRSLADRFGAHQISHGRASTILRREILKLTALAGSDVFIFMDDFHLVQPDRQPELLEILHGAAKGARSWLKISGLPSLVSPYDPAKKRGLQTPGDAQVISLDLTLADPKAAEDHLRNILSRFLHTVGIERLGHAIADPAFHRLVWANAGVPRDFLQMFASSIDHASRAGRRRVELTDANLGIGELGQQKMKEFERDAGGDWSDLGRALKAIEKHCLEKNKVNAFLIRSEDSEEFRYVQTLSDLRLVHILHRTITPHKAGERYEAYMLDYSLFTGFRRRPNIQPILPANGQQFKAAELRRIPILPKGFVSKSH